MTTDDRKGGEFDRGEDQVLESARVVAVERGGAWLEASSAQGCANCRDGKGCGVSVFQRLFRLPRHRVYLPTDESLAVGDHVIVAMSQRALLIASVWLYLVPLAGLLGGAIILDALFSHEALTALGALGGLVAALWIARAQQHRQARSGGFSPVLHEVILRQADS